MGASLSLLLALMAVTAAWGLPSRLIQPRASLEPFITPQLEHLIWWESFSEVEQTKGVLRGLGLQAVAEIRSAFLKARHDYLATHETDPKWDAPQDALATAIQHTTLRLREFQGTAQTPLFQGELLRLLRRAGRHQDWLDLYLDIVYRQPGNPLITSEAPRAAEAAKLTEREAEWRQALDHWNQIPKRYRLEDNGPDEFPPTAAIPFPP